MNRRSRAFTVVELLIVVVIIVIIGAISLASYTAIQKRSFNASQIEDMNIAMKAMETYRAKNGHWPQATAGNGYCIGTGFPDGKCRDSKAAGNFYLESDRTITDALATVTKIPNKKRELVNGTSGPYIIAFSSSHYRLFGVIRDETCPSPFLVNWNDPSSDRLLCHVDFIL